MYLDPRQPLVMKLHPNPPASAVPAHQKLYYEGLDEPGFRSSLPAAPREPLEPRPASSWKARPTHGSDRSCEAYGETSNQKILCQASDSTRGYLSVFLEIVSGEISERVSPTCSESPGPALLLLSPAHTQI